jgi:hypothetical protein
VTIRPELKQQIETRIKEFLNSTEPDQLDLRHIAAKLNVLPLLLDMGGCFAIRPEGEIISFAWEEEEDFRVEKDQRIQNTSLYQGSKKYPELTELIPLRSSEDKECPHCKGTGTLAINAELRVENILCYCGGLGWLPKEDEASP